MKLETDTSEEMIDTVEATMAHIKNMTGIEVRGGTEKKRILMTTITATDQILIEMIDIATKMAVIAGVLIIPTMCKDQNRTKNIRIKVLAAIDSDFLRIISLRNCIIL